MFSQASVILFTGGVCGRHPPGLTPPRVDTPPTATAADGTHPTGMHSNLVKLLPFEHPGCTVKLLLIKIKIIFVS